MQKDKGSASLTQFNTGLIETAAHSLEESKQSWEVACTDKAEMYCSSSVSLLCQKHCAYDMLMHRTTGHVQRCPATGQDF